MPDPNKADATKILVIGINYLPEMIGCSRYTSDLVRFIAGADCRTEVVTAPPHYPGWEVQSPYRARSYKTERTGNVTVIRCPIFTKRNGGGLWRMIAPMTFGVSSLPAILWRAIRFRPDVILCVFPTLFAAPAAVLARRLTGASLVYHVQDLEVDAAFAVGHLNAPWLHRVGLAFEWRMLGAADRVISISQRMCDRIAAKGVPSERISLVRNWVDTKQIHPRGDGAGFRRRHAVPADAFTVMYAGHVGAKQALEVLLDAARLCHATPRLSFIIAGDGPMKSPLMATYADLSNVVWLPLQPECELCDMLNAADVHVLPQRRSAADLVLPSKLGGMLASGKRLIIAADRGTELADLLDGAATLVPPEDPAALADAVMHAFDQPDPDATLAARLSLAAALDRNVLLQQFQSLLTSTAETATQTGLGTFGQTHKAHQA
jgi:colanic acid biosynthesis glycosyl transferase WcaI